MLIWNIFFIPYTKTKEFYTDYNYKKKDLEYKFINLLHNIPIIQFLSSLYF